MRVLVTGGRNYSNAVYVFECMDEVNTEVGISLVIHGACPVGAGGADFLAEDWAKHREIPFLGIPARFKAKGPAAGPARNGDMLRRAKVQLVLAFPGGRGTADMVKKARAANIEVREFKEIDKDHVSL